MKVDNTREVITSMTDTHDFKFNVSPHLFKILSDSLYSDKIGSIVRELASNCLDAHRQVGKENIAFDIYLPTKGLLSTSGATFSIRDYGPGLSHDDMLNIYTTYCLSTKTDSNDYIGAYGIGSKSPFAYIDSFTVISIYNKIKTTYSAFINDKGYPTLATLHSCETDEPCGLMVSIPVEEKDISNFCDAIKKQLSRFVVLPNIVGNENFFESQHTELYYKLKQIDSKLDNLVHVKFTDDISYTLVSCVNSSYTTYMTLIIAGICYYVSYENLRDKCKFSINIAFLKRHSLELYLDIGDIDLTASREDIAYTEKTISTILKKLKYTYIKIFTQIEQIPTIWEKCIQYNILFDKDICKYSDSINDFLDIDTIQNKIIFSDLFDMNIVNLQNVWHRSYTNAKKYINDTNVVYPNRLMRIIISPRSMTPYLYKNIYNLYRRNENNNAILAICPKKKLIKKQDIVEFMEYVAQICAKYNIPVIEYIPNVTTKKCSGATFKNIEIKYFMTNDSLRGETINITSIAQTQYYDDIKLSNTCAYILSDKGRLIFNNEFLKFTTFNTLKKYKLFGNINKVVILNKTQFKLLEKTYTDIQQFSFENLILKTLNEYYIKNRTSCIMYSHLYDAKHYFNKLYEIIRWHLAKTNNNLHSSTLKLIYKLYYVHMYADLIELLHELNICKIKRNAALVKNINKFIIKHKKLLYVINNNMNCYSFCELSTQYILEYIIGD